MIYIKYVIVINILWLSPTFSDSFQTLPIRSDNENFKCLRSAHNVFVKGSNKLEYVHAPILISSSLGHSVQLVRGFACLCIGRNLKTFRYPWISGHQIGRLVNKPGPPVGLEREANQYTFSVTEKRTRKLLFDASIRSIIYLLVLRLWEIKENNKILDVLHLFKQSYRISAVKFCYKLVSRLSLIYLEILFSV